MRKDEGDKACNCLTLPPNDTIIWTAHELKVLFA